MKEQGFSQWLNKTDNNKENVTGKIEFLASDLDEAIKDTCAVCLTTEWDEFLSIDFDKLRAKMKAERATIYDMRCFL
jgi:UDP-glucose 6-dehydrogenase